MAAETIIADSKPNYDNWGWDDYWSCEDWIEWYAKLKEKYGKKEADVKFETAFNDRSFGGHEWTCLNFDEGFKAFMRKEGGTTDPITKLFQSATTASVSVVDAAVTTTKMLKFVLPVALIGISGILLYAMFIKAKSGKIGIR